MVLDADRLDCGSPTESNVFCLHRLRLRSRHLARVGVTKTTSPGLMLLLLRQAWAAAAR